MFVLIKVKRNEIILKRLSGDRSTRCFQSLGCWGRRWDGRSGEPTGHTDPARPPTPKLKTPGNKGARKEQEDEDGRKKGQRNGGEASSPPEKTLPSLSLHVQGPLLP